MQHAGKQFSSRYVRLVHKQYVDVDDAKREDLQPLKV
jgi:hypothetical protein